MVMHSSKYGWRRVAGKVEERRHRGVLLWCVTALTLKKRPLLEIFVLVQKEQKEKTRKEKKLSLESEMSFARQGASQGYLLGPSRKFCLEAPRWPLVSNVTAITQEQR